MTESADKQRPERPPAATRAETASLEVGAAISFDALANDRPLPPLPDGGLAAAMPDWLRPADGAARGDGAPAGATGDRAPSPEGDGLDGDAAFSAAEVIDPTTFLAEDDLPDWLRRLATGAEHAATGGAGAPARTRRAPAGAMPERVVRPAPTPSPPRGAMVNGSAPTATEVVPFDAPVVAPPALGPAATAAPPPAIAPVRPPPEPGQPLLPAVAVALLLLLILVLLYATAR